MACPEDRRPWGAVVARLLAGPAPRGEPFTLCRRLLAGGAPPELARQAVRTLLEGAMADATLAIADAQHVMRILKAADSQELDLAALLSFGGTPPPQ